MQQTHINPNVLQEMLDSASNGAAKGQAQYFTPAVWGKVLSLPLNKYRPAIVDFTCGNGQLLYAARNHGSTRLLGCDIEPNEPFVTADISQFYGLLKAVDFTADCFVLNPPWDLHWYREPLAKLLESYSPAAALAFDAHDGRTSTDTIDSGVATLCMALDMMSLYGEGMMIWNEATLQRLVLGKDAPHKDLAEHIWAHLVIEGNICSEGRGEGFRTGVIYFARDHTHGILDHAAPIPALIDSLRNAEDVCTWLQKNRLNLRKGAKAMDGQCSDTSVDEWKAAIEEWERLNAAKPRQIDYNIFLQHGRIETRLSLFDKASRRVDEKMAGKLAELQGKQPMQLVVQVAHRRALEAACFGGPWRVDPALQQAVKDALIDYNRARAPLYPLPPIKRLGYLDEQDQVECRKDLSNGLDVCFKAGQSYALRSMTTQVLRSGTKMNIYGGIDDMEWNGSELGLFIRGEGREYLFMEGRLREKTITVSIAKPGVKELVKNLGADEAIVCAIDFTLQELVEHFVIPEVPDVASLDPVGYERNLKQLAQIEELCA